MNTGAIRESISRWILINSDKNIKYSVEKMIDRMNFAWYNLIETLKLIMQSKMGCDYESL